MLLSMKDGVSVLLIAWSSLLRSSFMLRVLLTRSITLYLKQVQKQEDAVWGTFFSIWLKTSISDIHCTTIYQCINVNVSITETTIIFIIFWDFLMFYQIFLSAQVKRSVIVTYKRGIYDMPHEMPHDLRLTILGN